MTETIQENQMEQLEQLQEPTITDGQTENLPPPPSQEQMEQIAQTTTESQCSAVVGSIQESEFYTKDEFFEVFKSVFDYAGNLTGTESLPIKQNELAGARITSDILYESCEKYAFMRSIIRKSSIRIVETILMIQFIWTKAFNVYQEKKNVGGAIWKKVKRVFGGKQKTVDVLESLEPQVAEKQQKPVN